MAGNANSGRKAEKPFRDALRMALKEAGEDHKALRMIAAKLIEMAASGDMQAIRELADRTDGKVPQAIVGDDELGPVNVVSRVELVALTSANSSN
jgi:hypothetical protein